MLENGVQVHGYRIDRLIGEGGMGVVYEATQLSLDRKVALKLLTAELSADAGFRERFRHEARIQGAMDHPNIVTVHEAGESDYGLFIAMELIRGATLKDLIVGRELDAGRTLRILSQVADALDSAHEFGLIHRDIKPHNILVRAGRRDHAFLADFGVTKVRGGTNLTKTGHFVGTVDYMAPEQIRGEPATRETDIYALGTVLYECLSGAVPFPKDSDVAVMYAHLADPPPTITSERPELPPQLDAVISTAMAKDPSERYSSAMRMIEAFEGALGADGQAAVSIPGPVETPQELGLREDGQPETAASATSPDATRMAPTPAPPTEVSATPPPPSEVLEGPPTKQQPTPPPPTPSPETEISAAPPVPVAPVAASRRHGRRPRPSPAGAVPAATAATAAGAEPVVPAPATPAAPSERKEFPWVWVLAAALVIALAAGGYFVGHAGGKKSSSSGSGAISVQNATVDAPSGWHEISAPKIPNLPLRQAVALSPAASNGMVMGLANLKYPWLLPNGVIGHEVAQAKTSYNQRPHIVKIGAAPGLADVRGQLLLVRQAALHVHLLPAGKERDHDGGLLLEDGIRQPAPRLREGRERHHDLRREALRPPPVEDVRVRTGLRAFGALEDEERPVPDAEEREDAERPGEGRTTDRDGVLGRRQGREEAEADARTHSRRTRRSTRRW